jgi:hypothetical protein
MIEGRRVAWTLKLIKTGPGSEGPYTDVVEINLPHDLGPHAHLGLTLSEAKLVLVGVQRAIGAAQVGEEAVQPPEMLQSPTSRQRRTQIQTPPMSEKARSPLPTKGEEDPVWGDLFGSMQRPVPPSAPAAESPTAAPSPDRLPTPRVRRPATKPKR